MATADLIGVPEHAVIPTRCPSWCSHNERFPGEHESAPAGLPVPKGLEFDFPELITSRVLTSDDIARTWVSVRSNGNGVLLDSDEADDFADNLMRLALEVRRQARIARAAEKGASA